MSKVQSLFYLEDTIFCGGVRFDLEGVYSSSGVGGHISLRGVRFNLGEGVYLTWSRGSCFAGGGVHLNLEEGVIFARGCFDLAIEQIMWVWHIFAHA